MRTAAAAGPRYAQRRPLVRIKRLRDSAVAAEMTPHLAMAAKPAQDNARYGDVHGVALESWGRMDEALGVRQAVHQRHPGHLGTLSALVTYSRQAGQSAAALDYARQLQRLMPDNPAVVRLVRGLRATGG